MKVIAISNHKGGVGKTTSTVNIGAGLANLGKKVLLIDLDPQANLTQSLGKHKENIIGKDIYASIKVGKLLLVLTINSTLHLIPATLDLSAAELELANETGREFILRDLIDPIKKNYDFILIDCPPSLGLLTVNAFVAAHEIYIPLQVEYLAMQGLARLNEIVNKVKQRLNKQLEITGVIPTQYDNRKILNRDVVETINNHFPGRVFNTKIRDNVALAEAPAAELDIFRYSEQSNGAQDYMNLCREILNR